MASALIQAGSLVNTIDREGQSPLHIASVNGSFAVLSMLLANKADFNVENLMGETPLICAAKNHHVENVKFLLECGADVNASDSQGRAALHWSVLSENVSILEMLLQRPKIVVNKLQHADHLSALDLAILTGDQAMIGLLRECGARKSTWIILFATMRLQRFWRACKENNKLRGKKSKKRSGRRKTRTKK